MTFLYLTVYLQGKRAILFDWKRTYPLQFISAILFAEVVGVSETRVRKGREREDRVWLFWNFLFYLLFSPSLFIILQCSQGCHLSRKESKKEKREKQWLQGFSSFLLTIHEVPYMKLLKHVVALPLHFSWMP